MDEAPTRAPEVAIEHRGQLVPLPVDDATLFNPKSLSPAATQWAKMLDSVYKTLETMHEFTVSVIGGTDKLIRAVRQANRHIALAKHRRRQDERRCYAKQARRECTGWRQW